MINKSGITDIHYDFARQDDVCSNFCMFCVESNPEKLSDNQNAHELQRWLPELLEGLLLVYLGTFHPMNKPIIFPEYCTDKGHELTDCLRDDLALWDSHVHSLNKAWPLLQCRAYGKG